MEHRAGSSGDQTADDGVNGRQLWSTDLVTNTTRRLTSRTMWGAGSNFNVAVNASGTTRNLTVAGNTLFLSANRTLPGDPSSGPAFEGFELWGLDLTEANRPVPLEIIVVNTTTLPSPGVQLLVRFSEPIWVDPAARGLFTIRIGGVVRPVTSIAPGLLNHELVINLAGPALARGDVAVRVTYADPSGDDAAGVIEDLAGYDVASFNRLAETFSNDADVTVLHPSYTNLILRGSARLGTANANANRITVEQNPAVTNVLVGSDLVDSMDGAGGRDIYVVTDPAHHTEGEITDSGAAADGRDELRFASTSASEQTLVVYGSDQGLEDVVIGVGTGNTADVTGTTSKNIDASRAANGLNISGNYGGNRLRGSASADVIHGNRGLDTMDGGAGADVYLVASAAEHGAAEINDGGPPPTPLNPQVDELRFTSTAAGDIITVFDRDIGLERVVLGTGEGPVGTAVRTGTTTLSVQALLAPNPLTILGNDGSNVITGTTLQDLLEGAGGNDLFMIPDARHHNAGAIQESIAGGIGVDEIRYSVPDSAPATFDGQTLILGNTVTDVERVVIGTGTSGTPTLTNRRLHINANAVPNGLRITGNNGANTIQGTSFRDELTGNNGNDFLVGGNGMDTLIGGNGNDRLRGGFDTDIFFFNASLVAGNRDIIEDFSASDDKLFLSRSIFTAFMPPLLGALQPSAFTIGTAATTANHRIIYNNITGSLSYDSDGVGGAAASPVFAILDVVDGVRPALTASNIITVA
jgi:Ca2+-binding RTX toxin-like protein